jgi:arabinan endo-1,5-alpha-L-arabinosidase
MAEPETTPGDTEEPGDAGVMVPPNEAEGGVDSTDPQDDSEMVPVIVGDDRCEEAVYDPANPPQVLNMSGSLNTHDPAVIEQDGTFYLFNTGRGLPGKTSNNLASWSSAGAAFSGATTSWVSSEVPQASDLWAPDLSFFNDQYHIYYSASSFGSNTSCIGHATRDSMASGSFTDHGPVICSGGGDSYNAIDANIIIDIDDKVWMFFGSHWDGIKAIELDSTGMSTVGEIYDIAARPQSPRAIEAPFVVRRCGYYYLFVSFDQCCNNWNDGVPYNIRVGRAVSLLGPYVDKEGTDMYPDGGGTLLLGPGGGYQALGHNAVVFSGGKAYNIYHAYNPGSQLRVAELAWDDEGWPISGGP